MPSRISVSGSCAPVLLLSGPRGARPAGRKLSPTFNPISCSLKRMPIFILNWPVCCLSSNAERSNRRGPRALYLPVSLGGIFISSAVQISSGTPEIVDHLKQCLELELDHGRANCLLGALLLENEESIPEAAEGIQRGVAQAPDWGAAHASMARLALRAGQYEVAVTASRAALENDECFDGVDGLCLVAEFLDGQRHDCEVAHKWTEHQMVAVAEGLYLAKRNPSLTEEVATASAALSRSLADVLVDTAIIQIHEWRHGGCRAPVAPRNADLSRSSRRGSGVRGLDAQYRRFEAAEANF